MILGIRVFLHLVGVDFSRPGTPGPLRLVGVASAFSVRFPKIFTFFPIFE